MRVAAKHAVEQRRSQSLVSICQTEIERMILEGELERGTRINELALAAQLGTSRGPLREACRSLTQAGLLETHANRGFFVRKLAHRDVVDLYDLRAALSRLAGALLAQRATSDQLAWLRTLVEAMDDARRGADITRFQELNAEFHAELVKATGNRRLLEVYDGLVKEMRLTRQRSLASIAALESSNAEHRAILDVIAARDAAGAGAAMENHLLHGKARFLSAAANDLDE